MPRKASLPAKIRAWLQRATGPFGEGGAGLVTTSIVAIALIGAAIYTWNTWGHLVAGSSRYHITAQSVELPESPDWISPATDIKQEVFATGVLNETNALDRNAATKIAQAFELNPWVKNVERVTKAPPNRVRIDLEYRRPVAVVWLQFTEETGGWEPVDAEGFILPEDRFHEEPERIEQYLPIVAQPSPIMPNDVGVLWPDDRVQQGAAIAGMLEKLWREWGIDNIYVTRSVADELPTFTLRLGNEVKIFWGHGPGFEAGSELKAVQKLALIGEYLKKNGAVDRWDAGQVLDVQHPGQFRVGSRPSSLKH